jgi:hypothetical protein
MITSRIAMVLVLLSSATPALAQAVTAFDGTYTGVSMTNSNLATYCTPPSRPAPGPLTIANGAARLPWGPGAAPLVGTVGPDGTLVMRQATTTTRFDGRVAGGGAVSGGITWGGAASRSGPCVWTLTWQKKS